MEAEKRNYPQLFSKGHFRAHQTAYHLPAYRNRHLRALFTALKYKGKK